MNYLNCLQQIAEKAYEREKGWEFSDELFDGTNSGEYKNIPISTLYYVWTECLKRINSKYFFSLLDDEIIPDGDARESIIHRPTHCMLIWGIYLLNNYSVEMYAKVLFKNILNKVFEHGIYAHGYEGNEVIKLY